MSLRARRTSLLAFTTTALVSTVLPISIVAAPTAAAATYPRSVSVALVPNSSGRVNNGGFLPTMGFPDGYVPTFTDVAPDSIVQDVANPLTGFDTVVFNGICDIDTFLSNAIFKARVEGFVQAGGKLIIWDSECTSTDYSKFALPFKTSNPGAAGASGTLTDVENNTLSSTDPQSPLYVDTVAVSTGTDAVGDANVFTTYDPNWFVDLKATNVLGVNGPAHAYAKLGQGLVIYSGLDKDDMGWGGFDATSSSGAVHLNRIWLLELLQPWDPDGLPRTLPAGTTHEYVALGDSYSAGEGLSPYLPGTDQPSISEPNHNVCHRSDQAYSYVLHDRYYTKPPLPMFVACSGSITNDLFAPNNAVNMKLDGSAPEDPQLDAITSQTKLVTLTMGGNDVGFVDIVSACAANLIAWVPSCQNTKVKLWAPNPPRFYEKSLSSIVDSRMQALKGTASASTFPLFGDSPARAYGQAKPIHSWSAILKEIKKRAAPDAKIIIAGYPQLLSDKNGYVWDAPGSSYLTIGRVGPTNILIRKGPASWIRSKIAEANQGIRAAAEGMNDPNVQYADVAAEFTGHAIGDSEPWIFLVTGSGKDDLDSRSLHPTADGQKAYELAVAKALNKTPS
ncbi:hypothetical protein Intca_0790 [Intrasporangium calvum DSM 43043]|uniref:SGNH hydrolase-type esterase domain-containing protein n=1 Tax=Intrasporangium calvum (strain ATCC 23552 / DSM 43043 / JCM 3097 / NBRC 12989 / NCIMB 10167 / NRRL B-3866 / 7 KIP) TaxID=710696 RepID=E6SBJ5_INTC7|nr:hypothetical protein Intca_0790 [Intrasporangium calvum DSM 43043]